MNRDKAILPAPPLPDLNNRWALFLDVDGTLLDFAPTPDAVQVPQYMLALLSDLQNKLRGAMALISGRSIATLDQLFKPLVLPSGGLHGVELRDAAGALHRIEIDALALEKVRAETRKLASAYANVFLEDKQYAVALHYDAVKTQKFALRAAVEALAKDTGFEIQPGRLVYELKPANVNKGHALAAFLSEPPFEGRLPIFIGDDITDEYALDVAHRRGGMAIQVGDRLNGAAQFALRNPADVLHWLQQWKEDLS